MDRAAAAPNVTMMVLQPPGNTENSSNSNPSNRMQHPRSMLRRRRSKGTIAGFALSKSSQTSGSVSNAVNNSNTTSTSHEAALASSSSQSVAAPQAQSLSSSVPSFKSHAGRMAWLCSQNAVRMGARTVLALTPSGRCRRALQTQLRQHQQQPSVLVSTNSYYSLERMIGATDGPLEPYYALHHHHEALVSSSIDNDLESDDDEDNASSGDEDDVRSVKDLLSMEPPNDNDVELDSNRPEPLVPQPETTNPNGAPILGGPGNGSVNKKLRKIFYFDAITATETNLAQQYLRQQQQLARKRAAQRLQRHVRHVQRCERARRNGEPVPAMENELEDKEIDSVSTLQTPMTSAMAAALLVESLLENPVESLPGMAKCYEGICAAGMAVLEGEPRSEIMAALAPLLISTLDLVSGETILALAQLRRLCGTVRYQTRFVQRIAPLWIRPPRSAPWCLRHQTDMPAVLAGAELVLQHAFDVFDKGWYERGQVLAQDSARAETLQSAATQLRNLAATHDESSTATSLQHRGSRRSTLLEPHTAIQEWEVVCVDLQIRVSIQKLFKSEWKLLHPDILPRPARSRSVSRTREPSPSTVPSNAMRSPRSPARGLLQGKTTTTTSLSPHSVEDRPSTPPPPPSTTATPAFPIMRNEQPLSPPRPTPPRSPKSPHRGQPEPESAAILQPPLSPKRAKTGTTTSTNTSSAASTPLSPSSVGTSATSGSGDALVSYTRLTGTTAGTTASIQQQQQAAQYRVLTSTAAERKRTVAACRALRAQISRFEDAFFQLHGRPPKGAAERAPLATTYAQYREWKRAIRADAACRIQALVRGAWTRWSLLRRNDARITKVVMARAGRSTFDARRSQQQQQQQENVIQQLSIPVEIGQADTDRMPLAMAPAAAAAAEAAASFGASSGDTQPLAPQWASKVVRRRSNSGDGAAGDNAFAPAPNVPTPTKQPYTSPSPSPTYSHTSNNASELTDLSLAELQARKRELKQQLKQYDMNFARKHGRMPVKAEKEPIRHLYEAYNALKSQINVAEQEGRHVPQQQQVSPVQSPDASPIQQQRHQHQRSPPGSDSGHSDESPKASPIPATWSRNKRKLPKAAPPPIASTTAAAAPLPAAAASAPLVAPSTDLAALKAEKGQLHQMLRSYEKDFYKEHKRQVSSFADIKPVASQYRRYKEIKKAIAALQTGSEK